MRGGGAGGSIPNFVSSEKSLVYVGNKSQGWSPELKSSRPGPHQMGGQVEGVGLLVNGVRNVPNFQPGCNERR